MNNNHAPDALLYQIADALGLTLNLMGTHFRGMGAREVHFGPWKVTTESSACSDILTPEEVSVWLRIHGRAWLYIVARADNYLKVYVVDANAADLRVKDQISYGGVSVDHTLEKLGSAIKAQFSYTDKNWTKE